MEEPTTLTIPSRADPFLLTFTKRCQTVCCLTGLTDDHCQAVGDPEPACGNGIPKPSSTRTGILSQILDHILCSHSYMVSRAAGHDIDLAGCFRMPLFIQTNLTSDQSCPSLITEFSVSSNCFRLLMDLFHHEMLITGFLRCLCIPLNDLQALSRSHHHPDCKK